MRYFFHINPLAIKYLVNISSISDRLARLLLLMQEFDITIMDKPVKSNAINEFLFHLHVPEDPTAIDDSFLDKHLLLVSTQNPWYANIANYLTMGREKTHFFPK